MCNNRQIHKDRKLIDKRSQYGAVECTVMLPCVYFHKVRWRVGNGCQGLEKRVVTASGYKVSFGGSENVIELDSSDGYINTNLYT